MLWTVFLLIVIVQIIQEVGMRLSRRMDARLRSKS
jgi:ABC-type methionine transport system permease subunit